jgi:hypothetical protein
MLCFALRRKSENTPLTFAARSLLAKSSNYTPLNVVTRSENKQEQPQEQQKKDGRNHTARSLRNSKLDLPRHTKKCKKNVDAVGIEPTTFHRLRRCMRSD